MDIGSPSESTPLKPRDRILRVMLDFIFCVSCLYIVFEIRCRFRWGCSFLIPCILLLILEPVVYVVGLLC